LLLAEIQRTRCGEVPRDLELADLLYHLEECGAIEPLPQPAADPSPASQAASPAAGSAVDGASRD
jgi:hypothetical protein